MTKTKSQPPGALLDNSISSARRLGSFASLHSILPFARRRAVDSTEDIAIYSDATALIQRPTLTSRAPKEMSNNITFPVRQRPEGSVRRQKYNILDENPQFSLPRSKTFSNLPLAVKSKDKTKSIEGISDRQADSKSKSSPIKQKSTSGRGGPTSILPRSRTQPLITLGTDESTVEKENTAPSYQRQTLSRLGKTSQVPVKSPETKPILFPVKSRHGKSILSVPKFESESLSDALAKHDFAYNSEISTRERSGSVIRHEPQAFHPREGGGAARWKSQPLFGTEPELVDDEPRGRTTEKRFTTSSTPRRSPSPERRPTPLVPTFHNDITSSLLSASRPKPHASFRIVGEAQPPSFWGGRLTALLDIEKHKALEQITNALDRAQTDALYESPIQLVRTRRALEELYLLCTTEEARRSFLHFQREYATLMKCDDLARPLAAAKAEEINKRIAGARTDSDSRKVSFMDRLLGRSKRVSLA